jgi:DNA-binding transcriptional MocR family regulator
MPDAHKQRLVAWCEARGITLIEDDSCAATYEGETPLAAAKTWDTTGNVIHCASLHKVLAPGMRLGWIAAGKWQARVEMLKFGLSRPNEMLAQIAVADFMGTGAFERHLRRLREQLRIQREWMAQAVAAQLRQSARAGARTRVGNRGRCGASAGTLTPPCPPAPPRPAPFLRDFR